jgi:pimeloyl-ACP methyl ester carboxylesterase
MGRDRKRPPGYAPFLELYLRKKLEGGSLLVPGIFHGKLDAIARRECLVLVHGFNNTEGEAAAAYFGFRTRQNDIFAPADPFIFDRRFGDSFWPGDADWWWFFDKVDFLIYPSAVHTAVKAGEQLANLLFQMPNLERVDFIGHSLGCRVALETLSRLRARAVPLVGRVSLMAAAVPSEMLEPGGRYYDLLGDLSREGTLIQVLHSRQDAVLHYAFPPGQALAGGGEASARALGRFGPLPSMPGFGSTLTEREIPGASHGDYWGQGESESSLVATEAAGRFLALGDIDRELGVPRSVGVPIPGEPPRDLGIVRDLGGAG